MGRKSMSDRNMYGVLMSSGDMATVKRLAAHRARPRRKGDTAAKQKTSVVSE